MRTLLSFPLTLTLCVISTSAFAMNVSKNGDNTVTFRGSGEKQTQVRNGVPVSKTYVKNEDGTVTFQETQVLPAEGQPQQPVTVPTAVPYPTQPYVPGAPIGPAPSPAIPVPAAPSPYAPQPQPNVLPSGVVNPNAVIRVENLQNPTTNPNPTNSLGTFNQR